MKRDDTTVDVQETEFKPLSRGRANTWHGPGVEPKSNLLEFINEENIDIPSDDATIEDTNLSKKLASNRRNAWGNMSYSDLIMQAIETSEEKRLTLVQIYEWMIDHVPYFQERAEGSMSVGWKNSIRHNLSLHPQFMRQPNDKTGKSSWWTINHSAIKLSRSRRTNIISEANQNKFYPSSVKISHGKECTSIMEGIETDALKTYLPAVSSLRKRTFSNPHLSSNDPNSDLHLKMLRRASMEINQEIESLVKLRPRAPLEGFDFFKLKPLLAYLNEPEAKTDELTGKQEDASRKEVEWFIPSGQFNLLNNSQKPKLSSDYESSLLTKEESVHEKELLFQLMKSEKIMKLRQKNPEFERRLCEIKKKKVPTATLR